MPNTNEQGLLFITKQYYTQIMNVYINIFIYFISTKKNKKEEYNFMKVEASGKEEKAVRLRKIRKKCKLCP